jgi:hemerythrin-like domain-containing protein
MLDDLEAGTHVSRSELASVVDYLTLFGDLRHHDKEESLLVPVLIQHGFDWYEGPLAQMRRDHRQERYLVRVLSDLANQERHWSNEDRRHLLGVGREFIAFMRGHMARENAEILGPARERLPSEAKAHLSAEFRRFDAEHGESTDFAVKRAQIDSLLQRHSHPVP